MTKAKKKAKKSTAPPPGAVDAKTKAKSRSSAKAKRPIGRPKQFTSEEQGQKKREQNAVRRLEQSSAVSDIGDLPEVINPERKEACRLDLRLFLQVYFPNTTGLSPFSEDHDRMIARIQRCVLRGGRFVNAIYRGAAKTTVGENSVLWAILYGHRRFAVFFGADATAATSSIDSLQMELGENDLLYEDFPEVCHAIRALDGKPQRCNGQHYHGNRTLMEWTADRIVLPTIAGSQSSSGVVCVRGITAGFRGLKKKLPDGTQPRPDLIIGDDLQTDEAARTSEQVVKTLRTLRKGVVKLGGHRSTLAIVINATVIESDDAIERLLADPAWQGERIPMVRKWPEAHKTLWLGTGQPDGSVENYATLRKSYSPDTVGDQERAHKAATAFYAERREEMDRGHEVSWENCFDPETEISALQHAYNALIDDGEEAFASEYQNRPLRRDEIGDQQLKREDLLGRFSKRARGVVPVWATKLVAKIDVQANMLWYVVAAFKLDDFTGAVIDYGAWPPQPGRSYYTKADVRVTLQDAFPGMGLQGRILHGLRALTERICGHTWMSEADVGLRLARCFVDRGFETDIVDEFCRTSPHAAILLPSKGESIGPRGRPMSEYTRHPGEEKGFHWHLTNPSEGRRAIKWVKEDSNYWKLRMVQSLLQAPGDKGALTFFGKPGEHTEIELIADHLCAEIGIARTEAGRTVVMFEPRAGRPDNDLLDCLYGVMCAASMEGVRHIDQKVTETQKNQTSADEAARRRAEFVQRRGY